MKYGKFLILLVVAISVVGCSGKIRPYKKAGEGIEGKWITPGYKEEGYLDEKLSEGVYWIEYFAHGTRGGYGDPIPQVMEFAHQRARELCPSVYSEEFKVIPTTEARFPALRCEILGCTGMRMVSGKVSCKK